MTRIPTPRVLVLVFAFAVCSVLGARSARADGDLLLAVGTASEHQRAIVASALDGTLRSASWSPTAKVPTSEQSNRLEICMTARNEHPWRCLAPIAAQLAVTRVVIAKVSPESKSVHVSLYLATEDDHVHGFDQAYCSDCTDASLTTNTTDAAKRLLQQLAHDPPQSNDATLDVRTTPAGAHILVDGVEVGISNREVHVSAEPHVVTLHLDGHDDEVRKLAPTVGQKLQVEATLRVKAGPTDHVEQTGVARAVSGTVIGVGGAALVGGTMWSLFSNTTTGPQSKYTYSAPAIGLATAGALAVGVGIYLYVWDPPRTAHVSAPTIALTHGGAVAGWTLSF